MTSTPVSRYAETELGVHSVYAEAQRLQIHAQDANAALVKSRIERRGLEAKLLDREMELSGAERGKNPDMSQAAMDKHLKMVFHADGECRRLRVEIMALGNEIDTLEMDHASYKKDVDIQIARMVELGGYMNLLAAEKNAKTA